MPLQNIYVRGRYTDTKLGQDLAVIRDSDNIEHTNAIRLVDSNGKEQSRTEPAVCISGLDLEHNIVDVANNTEEKKRPPEIIENLVQPSYAKEIRKNKGVSKYNWRNAVFKSTILTRSAARQGTPDSKR
jgi:hypothetical protein